MNINNSSLADLVSKVLNHFPGFLFWGQRFLLKMGRLFDLNYAYRSVKRLGWLESSSSPVPWVNEPSSYSPNDEELCFAIQDRFRRAVDTPLFDAKSLWGINTERYGKSIQDILLSGTPNELSSHLGSMFEQDFVIGYATGSLLKKGPHRRHFVMLGCVEQIVSLAEVLGIARAECVEQGQAKYALEAGLENLLKAIESAIGIDISFPTVGAPSGIKIGRYLVTAHSLGHIYGALRIRELFGEFDRPVRILEIGAGYGGTAYWLYKLASSQIESYSIVDLPLTNVAQSYFLNKTGTPCHVLNGQELNEIQPVDIVINQDSFPEMPEREVRRYLEWSANNAKLIYSYNQEAYAPVAGKEQVWTHKLAKDFPLRLRSRLPSWMRRGYVEEVYESKP
jgi:hypothetical protein